MGKIRKPRKNRRETSGEIYIAGVRYSCKVEKKSDMIEWLKALQDKYS